MSVLDRRYLDVGEDEDLPVVFPDSPEYESVPTPRACLRGGGGNSGMVRCREVEGGGGDGDAAGQKGWGGGEEATPLARTRRQAGRTGGVVGVGIGGKAGRAVKEENWMVGNGEGERGGRGTCRR